MPIRTARLHAVSHREQFPSAPLTCEDTMRRIILAGICAAFSRHEMPRPKPLNARSQFKRAVADFGTISHLPVITADAHRAVRAHPTRYPIDDARASRNFTR